MNLQTSVRILFFIKSWLELYWQNGMNGWIHEHGRYRPAFRHSQNPSGMCCGNVHKQHKFNSWLMLKIITNFETISDNSSIVSRPPGSSLNAVLNGHIDDLEQNWSNSTVLTMELLQSCSKPPICRMDMVIFSRGNSRGNCGVIILHDWIVQIL